MNKLLVIGGPTATGKTGLGIKMAQKFDGEIVSADSRQVYREMNIITGKEVSQKIKTWLIDLVNPDEKCNVADFYNLAWKAIANIWKREKLPIIVGGTGFYLKAILEGIGTMGVEPDWELRKQLSKLAIEQLVIKLEKLDPKRYRKMNESDRKNPRRLIRAIEIAKSRKSLTVNREPLSNFDALLIGLTAPHKILYQRIDQRVEERVKMGAEEEIKKLLAKKYTWENSVLGATIGYREWQDYFEGKATKEAVIQKWKFAEHNYARRQMTWFRKTPGLNWFSIQNSFEEAVEKLVQDWYS